MILPRAPAQYSQSDQQQARDVLTRNDNELPHYGRDWELARGERLILRSPNGSRWALSVSDGGALSVVAA